MEIKPEKGRKYYRPPSARIILLPIVPSFTGYQAILNEISSGQFVNFL